MEPFYLFHSTSHSTYWRNFCVVPLKIQLFELNNLLGFYLNSLKDALIKALIDDCVYPLI